MEPDVAGDGAADAVAEGAGAGVASSANAAAVVTPPMATTATAPAATARARVGLRIRSSSTVSGALSHGGTRETRIGWLHGGDSVHRPMSVRSAATSFTFRM
ncbi:hypothetical protein Adu01nite_16510 [Paractinoplanes durhamensis]|uniref:Uncharacterized protein n=1 Tax=Paractinoplanes durhamensis TaxID=113563 RepID=A0ABQ3YRU8_9ACTN|nr:hypothetical protein Adu01nite_16510 [Actinoplanes durhamensis]